jgi:catechol-2,3-dioxygenase
LRLSVPPRARAPEKAVFLKITGMNHAVLYVRNADRTALFYEQVLGFSTVIRDEAGRFVFMRAPASENHHDIAFFTVGEAAADSAAGSRSVGLYHIAWEVPTLPDLQDAMDRLSAAGALAGSSDHGANKSVYGKDPDGLEFEVMWLVPKQDWGEEERQAIIRPLDLAAEQRRFPVRSGQV